mgnify:CR=1 FL=1
MNKMKKIFDHIDKNKKVYIQTLADAVAIKSVSAWTDHRDETMKMVNWIAEKLTVNKITNTRPV